MARRSALASALAALSVLRYVWAAPFSSGELSVGYSETYLVSGWDGVKAFAANTPYLSAGPCLAASRYSNITLNMDPKATNCSGLGGQCRVNLIVTVPAICSLPAPYPTVMMFAGYRVKAKYYASIADRLASWGYAVIQYDRSELAVPPSEVESAYVAPILSWAAKANATARHPLVGQLDTSTLIMLGHSMGGSLASIAAAGFANLTQTMVLLDPVDYTQLSLRVARKFLQDYSKPVAILPVGIHCADRTGCVPFLDHSPNAQDNQLAQTLGCKPDWWCCDWDDHQPGLEVKTSLQDPTDGADGYIEFAVPGSMVATLRDAGHMSFLDYNPTTDPAFVINCPWKALPSQVLPDVLPLVVGWVEHKVRGVDITPLADWAAAPGEQQRLQFTLKKACLSTNSLACSGPGQ